MSEHEKQFALKEFRNAPADSVIDAQIDAEVEYNEEGYKVIHQCPIKRYFMQGIEAIDARTLMVSAGWYAQSKLVLLDYSFEHCRFDEIFEEPIGDKYFAEGLSLSNENKIYQLTYKEDEIIVWNLTKQTGDAKRYVASKGETKTMPEGNSLA